MRRCLPALAAPLAALVLAACAPARTQAQRLASLIPGSTSEVFESEDFIVTVAGGRETPERLAARFLGDPAKAWMIVDYNERSEFARGQEVVIPKRPWALSGVSARGYQLVPVLVYHNIGPQSRGRLVIATSAFEEQMRYLKRAGYRVIRLEDLIEHTAQGRQLPRKSVVLTFDDGYKSFLRHAYPVLKDLGFTATLFVYTDYVGSGSNAMDWDDLRRLADEGFSIGAHSKTHSDLRRRAGEPMDAFTRRMQAELGTPLQLFKARLGREPRFLAYPYGAHDDDVVDRVREHGYVAGLSVRREGNPAFVHPLRIHRSQIYAEMTLEEFARNLTAHHQESLLPEAGP